MIFCFIMIFASCPWLQGKWSCCSDCSKTPFCFALEENGSHCPHWGGIFCLRQGLLGFSFQVDTLVTIGHRFWGLYFTIEKGNCTTLLVSCNSFRVQPYWKNFVSHRFSCLIFCCLQWEVKFTSFFNTLWSKIFWSQHQTLHLKPKMGTYFC